MNTSEVPKEVLELAMSIVHTRIHDFPEDEWIPIGHNFELNMFIRVDEFRHQTATLYRVVDGKTDTQDFVRIWDQHIVDKEYEQFQQEQNVQMETDYPERYDPPFDDVDHEPLGMTMSRLNPNGIFTPDGQQIGSTCHCEDYPCCGH